MLNKAIFAAFVVFLPFIVQTGTAESPTPPDLLFIVLDDAGADVDWMGGAAYMPNLSSIAAQGVTFHNMTTDSSVCNPARVSMLSGLWPTSTCVTDIFAVNQFGTGMKQWRQYANECPAFQDRYSGLDADDITTIIDLLDEDYITLATGKVWHDGVQQRIQEGGSINRGQFSPTKPKFMNEVANTPLNSAGYVQPNFDWGVIEDGVDADGNPLGEETLRDYILADDFIRQLNILPDGFPVAGFFGVTGMHTPHYVPQRLHSLYDDVPLPPVLLNQQELFEDGTRVHAAQLDGVLTDDAAWRDFMQSYLASLTFADEQIGRVWDAWVASGRDVSNSVVVLWSDHGYSYGQHLNLTKTNLWDEQMRVPFFVAGPTVRKGVHSYDYTNSVDIYLTIVELLGLDMPDDGFVRDGVSLTDIVVDGERRADAYGITCVRQGCAITDGKAALIDWSVYQPDPLPEAVGYYNLLYDPHQLHRQPLNVTGADMRGVMRQTLDLGGP